MEFFFFCIQQYLPGCIALHSSSFEFLKALQMGYQKNMTNTEGSRWVKHDNPADWVIDPHVFAVICFFLKKYLRSCVMQSFFNITEKVLYNWCTEKHCDQLSRLSKETVCVWNMDFRKRASKSLDLNCSLNQLHAFLVQKWYLDTTLHGLKKWHRIHL